MKTFIAYALGFSVSFTVIAGGMYFVSQKYPWMFGITSETKSPSKNEQAPAVAQPTSVPIVGLNDSAPQDTSETISTLKHILAVKNDSLTIYKDSLRNLIDQMVQLQKKNSDAINVIAQLQSQASDLNNQRRKDLAAAYNDMDPAAAAKILSQMSDRDIIFILSNVQKKQVARILSSIDPARAAKLMTDLTKTPR
jgi:flagellar motility protein MotE (MotC chaperone)